MGRVKHYSLSSHSSPIYSPGPFVLLLPVYTNGFRPDFY